MIKFIQKGIFILTLLVLYSCSQCWECSYTVDVIVSGDTIKETVVEETCLIDEKEQFESNDYDCSL